MLVLSRKQGERIRIGDHVEVTVLAVQGSRVKLGFSGPPDVSIQRNELLRRAANRREVSGRESAVAAVR